MLDAALGVMDEREHPLCQQRQLLRVGNNHVRVELRPRRVQLDLFDLRMGQLIAWKIDQPLQKSLSVLRNLLRPGPRFNLVEGTHHTIQYQIAAVGRIPVAHHAVNCLWSDVV